MKKCPHCGKEIQDDASKCEFCKQWLEEPSASTAALDWIKRMRRLKRKQKSEQETEDSK